MLNQILRRIRAGVFFDFYFTKCFLLLCLAIFTSQPLFAQREIILNTTGYGFDNSAFNGINPEQWTYIQKFAKLKYNGKNASVSAIRLHVQWEQYEPAVGDYRGQKLAQAVQAILDLNPNMKIALHFSFQRNGYANDQYLSLDDVAQTYEGIYIRDPIVSTCASIFSDYASERFLAFVNDALNNIQPFYSRLLYVQMGNSSSEEYYVPYLRRNNRNFSGIFEAKALQAWRDNFLPLRFPNQANATWGRQSFPIGNAPQPKDGNYNSEMGRDLHRFASWGLINRYKGFYDAVKSHSPDIKVLYFISDFGSIQGNTWHLHNSTIPLALELGDGIYTSDGTNEFDAERKILGIDCIKGTNPNKIAAIEFDPEDLGKVTGGIGINEDFAQEWFQRAYVHGADYVHFAMHFQDLEIEQLAPVIYNMKKNYVEKDYQPPARESSIPINIFPKVFTDQPLFDTWQQIGGANWAITDQKPKSIKVQDAGYWTNIWDTSNFLPCTFNISATTSEPRPLAGSSVLLVVNCDGPECDGANFTWKGTGVNNMKGNVVIFDAPAEPGVFNYTVTSARSGCMPKTSTATLTISGALPVTLIEFNAIRENKTALLNWSTSAETESKSFEIEHSSTGKTWSRIGTVMANGKAENSVSQYRYTDENPVSGQNLYRLKMIDQDGTFAYSRIFSLNFNMSLSLNVFPNPATDRISINAKEWSNVTSIQIVNSTGHIVYNPAGPKQEINVSALASGSYIIKIIRVNGEQETIKFIKKD